MPFRAVENHHISRDNNSLIIFIIHRLSLHFVIQLFIMSKLNSKLHPSVKHRQEGTKHYNKVLQYADCQTLFDFNYSKAIECYMMAVNVAQTKDHKASAYKNLGMVYWTGGKNAVDYHDEKTNLDEYFHRLLYRFSQALLNLHEAEQNFDSCKTLGWLEKVKSMKSECLENAFDCLKEFPKDMMMGGLEQIAGAVEDDEHKMECYHHIGMTLFHLAILSLEAEEFKESLHCLKECYRPIEEIKKRNKFNGKMRSNAKVLEDDVWLQTCCAEALQALSIGE